MMVITILKVLYGKKQTLYVNCVVNCISNYCRPTFSHQQSFSASRDNDLLFLSTEICGEKELTFEIRRELYFSESRRII